MSKKSIYQATYGRLDEMDRSQRARDASFARGQFNYDMEEPDYNDSNQDLQYAELVEKATEIVQYDANLEGYDDMDEYARVHLGYQDTVDNDGNALQTGALYYNTSEGKLKFYNGSAWVAVEGGGASAGFAIAMAVAL